MLFFLPRKNNSHTHRKRFSIPVSNSFFSLLLTLFSKTYEKTKTMAQFDSLATPMISTAIPEFIPIDTDATPYIVNGRISETGHDFINTSTTYEELPSVISAPTVPELPINRSESTPILSTRLWENRLYAKRVTRVDKFKQLHRDVFPELTQKQMIFVYFNYFTKQSTHYDVSAEFENWDAPDNIKEIVQTRLAQQILSDH